MSSQPVQNTTGDDEEHQRKKRRITKQKEVCSKKQEILDLEEKLLDASASLLKMERDLESEDQAATNVETAAAVVEDSAASSSARVSQEIHTDRERPQDNLSCITPGGEKYPSDDYESKLTGTFIEKRERVHLGKDSVSEKNIYYYCIRCPTDCNSPRGVQIKWALNPIGHPFLGHDPFLGHGASPRIDCSVMGGLQLNLRRLREHGGSFSEGFQDSRLQSALSNGSGTDAMGAIYFGQAKRLHPDLWYESGARLSTSTSHRYETRNKRRREMAQLVETEEVMALNATLVERWGVDWERKMDLVVEEDYHTCLGAGHDYADDEDDDDSD
ncbi:hypothetical protein PVAG01_06419 [Phlyctema vagabunda]|uniref:Uncharacterized protein n=1 Tax=Phlyctema vagabunda TaxID=108571 RepID=A0ABR4PFZ3_9HELO